MILLRFTAYWFTRSSAILSDAAESIVHVVAVAFAARRLRRRASQQNCGRWSIPREQDDEDAEPSVRPG